jgi:hypothetical protein
MFWGFLRLVFSFLGLDLLTFVLSLKTYSSATGFPESQESADSLLHLLRRLDVGACFPHTRALFLTTGAWSSCVPPLPPSASALGSSKWFRFSMLLRGHHWAAHGSHAPPGATPTQPVQVLQFVMYFFLCISGLFCCTPLSMFTLVFVFESLWLNTLVKSPLMVNPALWHPCLRLKNSYLRKHCPHIFTFLVLFLGCPGSTVFFISCL